MMGFRIVIACRINSRIKKMYRNGYCQERLDLNSISTVCIFEYWRKNKYKNNEISWSICIWIYKLGTERIPSAKNKKIKIRWTLPIKWAIFHLNENKFSREETLYVIRTSSHCKTIYSQFSFTSVVILDELSTFITICCGI